MTEIIRSFALVSVVTATHFLHAIRESVTRLILSRRSDGNRLAAMKLPRNWIDQRFTRSE